jgi:hypothetical protein
MSMSSPVTGMWSIAVLGIPLAVLAAALGGAAFRHLREPALPESRIPARVIAIVSDGFIGGWLALLLSGLPATNHYIGTGLGLEVVAATCALLVQFLHTHGPRYADRLFEALLAWLPGKRGGGGS